LQRRCKQESGSGGASCHRWEQAMRKLHLSAEAACNLSSPPLGI
jgi:hypothetical protein